jgi:hypothetical protein
MTRRSGSRISGLDDKARGLLLDVLSLVASADGTLNTPERRFLRRAARALGREIDLVQVQRTMEQLRRGEAPQGWLSEAPLASPELAPA